MKQFGLALFLALAGLMLASIVTCGPRFGGGLAPLAEQGGGGSVITSGGEGGLGGIGGDLVVSSSAGGENAGGSGGVIEVGAGGLGGIGGHPEGGSGGGGGVGGEPMPEPDVLLVWTLTNQQKPPNVHVSIGGLIDQPNGADQIGDIFTTKDKKKCITVDGNELQLVCNLGPLEPGTKLKLRLRSYWDSGGTMFAYYMCDKSGFPSSQCQGKVGVYKGDAKPANLLVNEFEDDKNASTPIPAPWQYEVEEELLILVLPSLP